MTRPGLTAIVTTLNEEVNVRECLESLGFADEILVVDSFSTDRTVEIARGVAGVKVVQREYFGSAAQKNWAMDQVTLPWLLIVDADERIPERLAREIQSLLERGPEEDHFFIRRENVFVDRVIRHSGWSTDKVVRLIRRGTARYPNRRVHADLAADGATPTLLAPMLHYTCRSLGQYLEKLHRYATWGAADAYRQGRRAGPLELLFRPFWRFVRMYVIQAGFLDGRHGLVLCVLQSWSVFLKWAKVWEWGRFRANGWPVDLPAYDESKETWEGT
ncbi:MAG TPA: glycosyltransferase family 2 protein [Thermoanaerobaculia bacterium]|jgi:glycosyltransferase involved in cell wall biosynthesis|nr:glycosyltransferase family 2 protein [Thermoanaerobaculia bacterium]